MNRYKLTFNNNQTLLLYAKSQDKLNIKLYENDIKNSHASPLL